MAKNDSPAASTYKRASDYDQFGKTLDTILEKDVLVRRFSISERPITDRETRERRMGTFVTLYINELDDVDAEPRVYHAWSASLAEKLGQIPNDDLPVVAKFVKVPSAQGNVYTIE